MVRYMQLIHAQPPNSTSIIPPHSQTKTNMENKLTQQLTSIYKIPFDRWNSKTEHVLVNMGNKAYNHHLGLYKQPTIITVEFYILLQILYLIPTLVKMNRLTIEHPYCFVLSYQVFCFKRR